MLDRVQLRQSSEIEFVPTRESFGMNHVNHIFPVHGRALLVRTKLRTRVSLRVVLQSSRCALGSLNRVRYRRCSTQPSENDMTMTTLIEDVSHKC